MHIMVEVTWQHVVMVTAAVALGILVWWSSPAHSQTAAPGQVSTFAFVARADNPVDALAASSVAGQLGAPVYLTASDSLDDQARQGLVDTDPEMVVLAGGTAALSEAVEQQIEAVLPDAQIRRFAGAGRTETARLLNELTGELGVNRPVLAGATVAGDVGIDGTLTVAGTNVGATLTALSARIDTLEADLTAADERIGALETDLTAADERIGALETTLAGVTREGNTLRFSGMNLQLVNGQGATDTSDGLGNLIVGYNAQRPTPVARTGSHYLIVGDQHEWTAYGGIVAGVRNTASGPSASVTGGQSGTASGAFSLVSGGFNNTANGNSTSVSGGDGNTASGDHASVSGGSDNTASGFAASVSGGQSGIASSGSASVSGGFNNTANGPRTSVSGGAFNVANGIDASVAGGDQNIASGQFAAVSGGLGNEASGVRASVSGGTLNTASGPFASVSGGNFNKATEQGAAVSGGQGNTASGQFASVAGGRSGTVPGADDSRIGNTDFPDS